MSEDDRAIRAAVDEALADLEELMADGEPFEYATVVEMPDGHEVDVRVTMGYRLGGGQETKATEAKSMPKEAASDE